MSSDSDYDDDVMVRPHIIYKRRITVLSEYPVLKCFFHDQSQNEFDDTMDEDSIMDESDDYENSLDDSGTGYFLFIVGFKQ
jgi:hypothetical protein